MLNDFLTVLKVIFVIFVILFGFIIFAILFTIGLNFADYCLDKSDCKAYVGNQKVYEGKAHYLELHSIGENGNSKKLTIFKDKLLLRPKQIYVNTDIRIEK